LPRPITKVSLIRPNKPDAFMFSPETVVIIGNGAVEGSGWNPAVRAIAKMRFAEMSDAEHEIYTKLSPEVLLAHAGFFSRITLLAMLRESSALDDAGFASHVRNLEPSLRQIENFRQELANEYVVAERNQDLRLRDLPFQITDALKCEKTGVITTNWDELIWKDLRFKNLIQLHGRASAPGTLILPTESMIDHDSIRNIHHGGTPSKKDEIIMGAYERNSRGESEARELFLGYAYSRNWIRDAKNLIIYGIAGHIYDVELHSLFLGMGDIPKESVIIINKDPNHIEQWVGITRSSGSSLKRVLA
jgi:hypothetical protein